MNLYNNKFLLLILVDQPCENGGECSHICAQVNGMAQCYCPLGLQLSMPGGTQCVGMLYIQHLVILILVIINNYPFTPH